MLLTRHSGPLSSQTMPFKSSTMPSVRVTTSATCVQTPAFPWCTSLTATVPPSSSCRLQSARCLCVPTTSPPWASLQKRWRKKSASISLTSKSPTIPTLSARTSVWRDARTYTHYLCRIVQLYIVFSLLNTLYWFAIFSSIHFNCYYILNWHDLYCLSSIITEVIELNVAVLRVTLQQTAGPWGLMTPMPGETGAGRQLSSSRSWCQTCCAPFETRGQTRVCQSVSKNMVHKDWPPRPWLFLPAAFMPDTLSFTSLSHVVNGYYSLLWKITSTSQWLFAKESRTSLSDSLNIQWTMRCHTRALKHTSHFF